MRVSVKHANVRIKLHHSETAEVLFSDCSLQEKCQQLCGSCWLCVDHETRYINLVVGKSVKYEDLALVEEPEQRFVILQYQDFKCVEHVDGKILSSKRPTA